MNEFDAEIEAWIETLSPQRCALIHARIERDTEDVYDEDEFLEIAGNHMKKAFFTDVFARLQGYGLIEPVGVDEAGEVCYAATAMGHIAAETGWLPGPS